VSPRILWYWRASFQALSTASPPPVVKKTRLRSPGASATRTLFDGFSRVYTEGRDEGEEEAERTLPALAEGDPTTVAEVAPTQHFTEPPPRFTEASLVKALEELGVGRPSTYAATLSTIVDRGYVTIRERRLYPEPVAEIVTDLLVEHFGREAESLPVVMDDILVNFDPTRAERAARSIEDLATRHQVLYFTCHPATPLAATRTIELPALLGS